MADDDRPDPALVWQAIDVYMANAYGPQQQPPTTVRSLLALKCVFPLIRNVLTTG